MTTLEKLYKPRDFRSTSKLKLDKQIVDQLPKYCSTLYGQKMDPINLVFIGTEAGIERAFEKAGWLGAHPSTPVHVGAGLISTILNKQYKKGPFMPLFTGIGLQDLSFQKTTVTEKFAQRHHLRVWRTRFTLGEGKRVWVGAATLETGMKLVALPPFVVHRLFSDIDFERDFIANDLINIGAQSAGMVKINAPISPKKPKKNPHRDPYYTDGRAVVIELP